MSRILASSSWASSTPPSRARNIRPRSRRASLSLSQGDAGKRGGVRGQSLHRAVHAPGHRHRPAQRRRPRVRETSCQLGAKRKEMSLTAKQRNRLLFTAFKLRFHDEVRRAKQLIDAGSLGRILNFRLMFGGYIDMKDQWYTQKAWPAAGSSWITVHTPPTSSGTCSAISRASRRKSRTSRSSTSRTPPDWTLHGAPHGRNQRFELVAADSGPLVPGDSGEDGAASLDARVSRTGSRRGVSGNESQSGWTRRAHSRARFIILSTPRGARTHWPWATARGGLATGPRSGLPVGEVLSRTGRI